MHTTGKLLRFATELERMTSPTAVINALDRAARVATDSTKVHVMGIWTADGKLGDPETYAPRNALFWHDDVPVAFRDEYFKLLGEHRSSPTQHYARTRSAPFTFSEAMRRMRTSGPDRWLFPLMQRHGMRDGLYCPFRHWMVAYWTPNRFEFTPYARLMLAVRAQAAVGRIEEIVPPPKRKKSLKAEPTEREIAALRLASHGLTAKQIAAQLELSVKTVQHHIESAIRKFGANNVTHAVAEAIRQGFIA